MASEVAAMAGELPIQKLLNKLGLAEPPALAPQQRGRDGAKAGDQVGILPAQPSIGTPGVGENA